MQLINVIGIISGRIKKKGSAMQTFISLAKSRRSIRNYSTAAIPKRDIARCAESARYAPSACNSEPWKFVIVDDSAQIKKIAKTVLSGPYKMNSFAHNAGAFIAIISEKVKLPAFLGGILRKTNFAKIDIGIACAHLVLEAQDLGIGSCILGWFNEKKLKRVLKIPRSKKIELLIAFGYPKDKKLPKRNLKHRDEVISFNKYC